LGRYGTTAPSGSWSRRRATTVGELDDLVELFTEDALLVTGSLELRGSVLTWCADERWRISERRIIPVFRDLGRAPITT
jgi:hypothetical protein